MPRRRTWESIPQRLPRKRSPTHIRLGSARRFVPKSARSWPLWKDTKPNTGPSQSWCAPTTSETMAQFDVFANPIQNARRVYPFVVAMHSDFTVNGAEQFVAPIVASDYGPSASRRVMPVVALLGNNHVVVVPRLTVMRSRDLGEKVSSIASARSELLAA